METDHNLCFGQEKNACNIIELCHVNNKIEGKNGECDTGLEIEETIHIFIVESN
jgi:hypothetical protein